MNISFRSLKNILVIVSLLSIVFIQLFLGIKSINEKWAIPSHDAYYFLEVSREIQQTDNLSNYAPNTYGDVLINYPSSHPLLFSMLSDISGIELETLYRYAGPILFSILLLLFYVLLSRLTKNPILGIIGVLLLGLVPYNLYRSTMPLPEVISIIFQVLTILVLILKSISWQKKAWIIVLLVTGATFLHYRSIALIISIVMIYIIVTSIKNYMKTREFPKTHLLVFIGICIAYIILIIPIINFVFDQYLQYLSPSQYNWQQLEPVPSRYVLPSFTEYSNWLGIINILFGFLGFFSLLYLLVKRKEIPLYLTICLWLLITLGLSQSLRYGFYAPPYRFYSFLSIPLVITAIIGIQFLVQKSNNIGRIALATMLFLFAIYTSIIYMDNNIKKSVFVAYYPSDFSAAEWLIRQENSPITISYGAFSPSLGVKNSEARFEVIHDIFLSETPIILNQKLEEYYPEGETIYLLIIHNMNEPILSKHPKFFILLEYYQVVFEDNETTIYLLRDNKAH
jgi:hypothetical protein